MKKQQVEVRDLARGNWPDILKSAGMDEAYLKDIHGPCPACGGTDRFRFDNKEDRGSFYCSNCGPGDGIKLLQKVKDWSFKEVAQFIRDRYEGRPVELAVVPAKPAQPKNDEADKARIKAKLLRIWKGSKKVTSGDPVWSYLVKTRKLPLKRIPSCIRYHPGLEYYVKTESGFKKTGVFPAMVTAVMGANGRVVALHRTYLTREGQKAPVGDPKKLSESCGMQGAAIRLAKAKRRMAVAEGIETAFAVMAITNLPCWATVNAPIMPKVVFPDEVEEVVIFADHDLPDPKTGRREGQDRANELAARLKSEGKKVQVVIPSQPGLDFDDVYQQRMQQKAQRLASRPKSKKVAGTTT